MRKKSHEANLFLDTGRIRQKMKTREKLLDAANAMLVEGSTISIEQVAKRAEVSKATAYRYFSSKDVLQKEASLHSQSERKEELFADIRADDLPGRIDKLIDYHYELLTNNEAEFRLFLSAVLKESVQDSENNTRAGRRIMLTEEALRPLQPTTPKPEFDKMVSAISVVLGIESLTVLKDLCQLENAEILETWKWMINKIIGV